MAVALPFETAAPFDSRLKAAAQDEERPPQGEEQTLS
jgi:hypothetical protein